MGPIHTKAPRKLQYLEIKRSTKGLIFCAMEFPWRLSFSGWEMDQGLFIPMEEWRKLSVSNFMDTIAVATQVVVNLDAMGNNIQSVEDHKC